MQRRGKLSAVRNEDEDIYIWGNEHGIEMNGQIEKLGPSTDDVANEAICRY